MAGVKGMKGSGGARPGAGRKPKPAADRNDEKQAPVPQGDKDMLQLLQDVALGRTEATSLQVRAAIAAVQYTHTKRSDGGKKEGQAEKAKKVASKFATATPPKLVAAGGRKI